ncbi:conserved hypothetical protein [delta proteobacterium NaphS2]|nr:conserved hypothetical protein [delta proteobacterium NaphS2]
MAMLLFSKVCRLKSKRAGRSEALRGPKKQKKPRAYLPTAFA